MRIRAAALAESWAKARYFVCPQNLRLKSEATDNSHQLLPYLAKVKDRLYSFAIFDGFDIPLGTAENGR